MFTSNPFEARFIVEEYDRRAQQAWAEGEARRAKASIEGARQGVRFPLPEWLKHAPFLLRTTSR